MYRIQLYTVCRRSYLWWSLFYWCFVSGASINNSHFSWACILWGEVSNQSSSDCGSRLKSTWCFALCARFIPKTTFYAEKVLFRVRSDIALKMHSHCWQYKLESRICSMEPCGDSIYGSAIDWFMRLLGPGPSPPAYCVGYQRAKLPCSTTGR